MWVLAGGSTSVNSKARNMSNTTKGINRLGSILAVPEALNSLYDLSFEASQYCAALSKMKGC